VSEAKSINEMESDLFLPEEVDRFSNPVEARKKAMDYLARREYGINCTTMVCRTTAVLQRVSSSRASVRARGLFVHGSISGSAASMTH